MENVNECSILPSWHILHIQKTKQQEEEEEKNVRVFAPPPTSSPGLTNPRDQLTSGPRDMSTKASAPAAFDARERERERSGADYSAINHRLINLVFQGWYQWGWRYCLFLDI